MGRILLATDGSKPSLRAEEFLANTYDPSEDTILVVSVVYVPEFIAGYAADDEENGGMTENEIEERFREQAHTQAEEAAERLQAEGYEVEILTPAGEPGSEICRVAQDEDVDCIIMGRRGQSSKSEPLMGSVSQYVLHNALRPVNVVPH